jgi:hypothetical protein
MVAIENIPYCTETHFVAKEGTTYNTQITLMAIDSLTLLHPNQECSNAILCNAPSYTLQRFVYDAIETFGIT